MTWSMQSSRIDPIARWNIRWVTVFNCDGTPSQPSARPVRIPRRPAEGFEYRDALLSSEEERSLLAWFADLPFREFEFGPYRGKRRVVSYGWKYDFSGAGLQKAEDIPAPLLRRPLRPHQRR
jgi:hypothetical protein